MASRCPFAGWCEVIRDLLPMQRIIEICETDKHEGCYIFLRFDPDVAIPAECLCKRTCKSNGCTRHPRSMDCSRHKDSFLACQCGKCHYDGFCFPLLAAGEEEAFVNRLSQANFQRLSAAMQPLMVREDKCRESRLGAVPITREVLTSAIRARLSREGGD